MLHTPPALASISRLLSSRAFWSNDSSPMRLRSSWQPTEDTWTQKTCQVQYNFATHNMLANSERRMQIYKGQQEAKGVKSANFFAS